MPRRPNPPPSHADERLVADACGTLLYLLERDYAQEEWMQPFIEKLPQALANVRGAVRRDRLNRRNQE